MLETVYISKSPSNNEIRTLLDNCKVLRTCRGKELKKGEFIKYKQSSKRILYQVESIKTVGIDPINFLPKVAEVQLNILGSYDDNESRIKDTISGKFLNDEVEVLDVKFFVI
jgi:hypothetical protein